MYPCRLYSTIDNWKIYQFLGLLSQSSSLEVNSAKLDSSHPQLSKLMLYHPGICARFPLL